MRTPLDVAMLNSVANPVRYIKDIYRIEVGTMLVSYKR